jgi:hypothetical protein
MNIMTKIFCAATVLSLVACAPVDPLPRVPLVENGAFPAGIPLDYQSGGYAINCEYGYYTGKNINEGDLAKTHGSSAQPDPAGKGKIYTRYSLTPDHSFLAFTDYDWGFTYTIKTDANGIVTECAATQQRVKK